VTTVERKLAGLARSSHGVVTRRELLRAGVSAKQIDRRLLTGALFAVFAASTAWVTRPPAWTRITSRR